MIDPDIFYLARQDPPADMDLRGNKNRASIEARNLWRWGGSLDGYYVGSLQSFGSLLDGEFNLLVLFQTLVAFHLES